MMTVDLYLRAGNAGAFATACPWLRGEDPDTGDRFWLTTGDGFVFDPIGAVTLEPAAYDDAGNELTPAVLDDRFHANLRCTVEIAALVPSHFMVWPAEPRRVWA